MLRKTLTIATGQTITAGGASNTNGTLSIEGSETMMPTEILMLQPELLILQVLEH